MNKIIVDAAAADGTKISRFIYGHFSEHLGRCIYEGLWVGNDAELAAKVPNTRGLRNDVVEALRKIRIPALRWPGGCFADEYHWEDGIGEYSARAKMVNTHWGGVTEDNSFGTHEFLDLCEQLSPAGSPRCEPYICGNVGSGTVRELSQWVEYCNFDGLSPMADLRRRNGREKPWNVKFWGIGNENWGCGGNMTPDFYADNYRRYATYARAYGTPLYKIACGSHDDYYEWTRVLMEKAGKLLDGLSLHYYTFPGEWAHKGGATKFSETEWFATLKRAALIDTHIRAHGAIMDEFDKERRVGMVVDEWGTWFDVENGTNPGFLYQQNTLRDALVAAIHLNAFNNYAERVSMANIAQTVNVLQSVVLTDKEKIILTPTYHIFDMYKVHQDAEKLPLNIESGEAGGLPALNASASRDGAGKLHISVVNVDPKNEQRINIELRGASLGASSKISAVVMSAKALNAHNTFDAPDNVKLAPFKEIRLSGGSIEIDAPPASVVTVEAER